MTVLVIGAGLSGLAAARTLQRTGQEVLVLEKAGQIGGRVQTLEIDGYRVDKGFQVLLTAYQEAAAVWPEDEMDLFPFAAGASIHGREIKQLFDPLRHPSKIWGTVSSKLFTPRDVKSLVGLRLGLQGIRGLPENSSTEQAPEFLTRLGFSKAFTNAFLRPFLGGVFLDESLSVPADAVRFVLAMFAQGEASLPARGMSELPKHLSQGLQIRCNCTVAEVEPTKVILDDGEVVHAKAIIDSRPPVSTSWQSTKMMAFRSPVPQDTTPVLHLANLHDLPDSPILHACAPSLVAPNYAPPGRACLYATLRTDRPSASLEDVRQTLSNWFGLSEEHIEHLTTVEVRQALPESPCQASQDARNQGIYRSGDWTTHASIEGALRSGRIAAESVLHDLKAKSNSKTA